MTAIRTQGLTKRFGKLTAVDHLDVTIEQGTLYGLIGPNGAGKTTTLRLLAGLLDPSEGEVYYDGQQVRDAQQASRLVGYMPDFFGVYEDLMVWEYLDFFARCYRIPTAERRQIVDELLALVDLNEKREAYVQTLSRGMRQRLCLAHALVHDPQILLLDEPASGLDPRARVEMRELLRELRAMGKTVVVSSHILSELAEMCDAVGIIEQGKLLISAPLHEVYLQVKQDRTLRLRVLSDHEQVMTLLRNYPGVGEVYATNGAQIEIDFVGDDADTAAMLTHLTSQGVAVVSFCETANDLEDVFLRITQGIVS
ncbi:MAG: ABC transporter ATP-binding protein [Chloroflexota bacterium]|nr:ABC transporter ATP-binding protein [Chloroflexota bacterium]